MLVFDEKMRRDEFCKPVRTQMMSLECLNVKETRKEQDRRGRMVGQETIKQTKSLQMVS
jgi:hypothetical protein